MCPAVSLCVGTYLTLDGLASSSRAPHSHITMWSNPLHGTLSCTIKEGFYFEDAPLQSGCVEYCFMWKQDLFFALCWLLQLAWHSEITYLRLHLHSPSQPILYEDYCVRTCGKRIWGGGVICVLKSFWIRSLGWKIPYFPLLLSLLFSLEHTLYYSISHSVVHSGLVWHHTCAGRKLDWARSYLTLELCWRSSTSDQSD